MLGGGPEAHRRGLLIYADNANHLGDEAAEIGEDQRRLIDAVHGHGLSTHDVVEPALRLGSPSVSALMGLGDRLDQRPSETGPWIVRSWRAAAGLHYRGLSCRSSSDT